MSTARRWCSRVLGLARSDRADREFADEIETLVARHVDEHRRAGLPPAEAERRARLAVGSVPALVESRRDGRGIPRIESLVQDLRHALRRLRHQPAFAIVCIAMLGLGTGVTAAIFSSRHPPAPEVYVYYEQGAPVAPLIVVRSGVDLASLGVTLRSAIREVDSSRRSTSARCRTSARRQYAIADF